MLNMARVWSLAVPMTGGMLSCAMSLLGREQIVLPPKTLMQQGFSDLWIQLGY
jgi:hypothetical protein